MMTHHLWQNFKQHFWPISAIIFCPCHLPLTMSAVASLTAGTFAGTFISAYYNSIESILAVAFSFYFVLAFMIWVVRGPQKPETAACTLTSRQKQQLEGLSTRQIVVWGIIGMFTMPALVSISLFVRQDFIDQTVLRNAVAMMEYNSGFIWLVSITTVVMIPVMLIWLVWLWLAWAKTDLSQPDLESWEYEYE
jgi:hypothetical protein